MFKGTKILIGPLLPNDGAPLFRWFNDTEAAALDLAFRPMDWVAYKGWSESLAKDPSRILFAIRRLDLAPIIGFVGITNIQTVHRSAELGVRIGEAADRGHGFGQEATRLALAYCWNHLNLNRVALSALAGNDRAIRAFEAAGFEREGLARRAAFINGAWHDLVIMGILRPERN
jgi:RimJ/RimL family protein N-acetyltransferase